MMLRCAIYTRKSTDEGLEQEFNSLDAQREACEAYIKSQKHEGWKLVPQQYDDGGYSGGSMERPALKKLLHEIEAGRIDIVVVYKVDRLSRSLSDFVRMVEQFDKNKVSFVSITQQFNTTTSMGRLTLNMLLSFAQFEREVTAERIRDKIAASKKKGMWMGSPPPLGYDVQDKKLVINSAEAKAVRLLFDLYLKLGTVGALKDEADRRSIRTKHRPKNKNSGNLPFSHGNLYALLTNPLYVGEVQHKKVIYPGQHQAIVDRKIWNKVQKALATNAGNRRSATNAAGPHLLTGRVFDEKGEPLCPTHTNKKGKRYHYYISKHLVRRNNKSKDEGWRLPAVEIEGAVASAIRHWLTDHERVQKAIGVKPKSTHDLVKLRKRMSVMVAMSEDPDDRNIKLLQHVKTAHLSSTALTIKLDVQQLTTTLGIVDATGSNAIEINIPAVIRRRGMETKLILEATQSHRNTSDTKLIELVAKAHAWLEELSAGAIKSLDEIVKRENIDDSDVSRAMPLAFLAPDLIESILDGNQKSDVASERLLRAYKFNPKWAYQRAHLSAQIFDSHP